MNWEAIKHIYYCVLIHNHKIEYLGGDKYVLTAYYRNGQKYYSYEYENGIMHGKNIVWSEKGRKEIDHEYINGFPR